MSRPTPSPEKTHAPAGPFDDAGGFAGPEAAVARASRRLRMITDLGDMAMTLARAVHERALAEEVAAKAAPTVREAAKAKAKAKAEPEAEPPAPPETVPSHSARSSDQTRAEPRARVGSRANSRAAGPAPIMDAGALFARLSDIVRQCLELEMRIDEELRRLQATLFVAHGLDATLGVQIDGAGHKGAGHEDAPHENPTLQAAAREEEDSRRYVARNRVGVMVEAVIAEEATTRQEATQLYTALRERLDHDEAYRDLNSRADAASAASLCRDLGLHPNPARWPHPPPDP